MQLSHDGLALIKDEEGFREQAYLDGGGVPTIGYGTTHINGNPIRLGMLCTPEQAEEWLYSDTAYVQTAINQLVKVPLTQNMFDALVSFVYNIGVMAFTTSSMLRLLNLQEYANAAAQFDRWNKDNGKVVPGLVTRRYRERQLFAS